jgi:hypothetical protein
MHISVKVEAGSGTAEGAGPGGIAVNVRLKSPLPLAPNPFLISVEKIKRYKPASSVPVFDPWATHQGLLRIGD